MRETGAKLKMTKEDLKRHLHECLQAEVMKNQKPFTWARTAHKAFKCPERRFNFWWRIASYLYKTNISKNFARRINRKLTRKYGCEIQLGASIGPGLIISHFHGVVINGSCRIGSNFKIRQNSTIGIGGGKRPDSGEPSILIGDNVSVGAGSCIIANAINIGSNVDIGAMSFINKDIPGDCVVYTKKTNELLIKVSREDACI